MSSILDDIRSQFNPKASKLNLLIIINVVVFVVLGLSHFFLKAFAVDYIYQFGVSNLMVPSDLGLLLFKPWTLLTYMFTHEGIWHILMNMLFLYYFGTLIEDYINSNRLIGIYLLGGLFSALTFLLFTNIAPGFRPAEGVVFTLLGASGAVYAIMVAAATLLPHVTFRLILIGDVRIPYIAGFYILLSLVSAPIENSGGNLAHLGGALFGYLFIKALRNGIDLSKPLTAFINYLGRLFSPKPKLVVTSRNDRYATASAYPGTKSRNAGQTTKVQYTESGVPSQEEIDAILDKINHKGYDGLTKEEKQKLFKAGQRED